MDSLTHSLTALPFLGVGVGATISLLFLFRARPQLPPNTPRRKTKRATRTTCGRERAQTVVVPQSETDRAPHVCPSSRLPVVLRCTAMHDKPRHSPLLFGLTPGVTSNSLGWWPGPPARAPQTGVPGCWYSMPPSHPKAIHVQKSEIEWENQFVKRVAPPNFVALFELNSGA